jgi:hypothetical protein
MLVQAIPGMVYWEDAGLYNVSGGCAAIPSLPPLTFTIDNVDYTLSPEQYILQVILAESSSLKLILRASASAMPLLGEPANSSCPSVVDYCYLKMDSWQPAQRGSALSASIWAAYIVNAELAACVSHCFRQAKWQHGQSHSVLHTACSLSARRTLPLLAGLACYNNIKFMT